MRAKVDILLHEKPKPSLTELTSQKICKCRLLIAIPHFLNLARDQFCGL